MWSSSSENYTEGLRERDRQLICCIFSPIIEIPHPAVLRTWYRKRVRHEARAAEGRESKPPAMPPQEDIFSRFPQCHLTSLSPSLTNLNFQATFSQVCQPLPQGWIRSGRIPGAQQHQLRAGQRGNVWRRTGGE